MKATELLEGIIRWNASLIMMTNGFLNELGKKENHNSVVMTVFSCGILDFSFSFLLAIVSLTSQGEMESNAFLPLLLLLSFALWPPEVSARFFRLTEFRAAIDRSKFLLLDEDEEADLLSVEERGSGILEAGEAAKSGADFLLTDERERVTGWLDANDVSWK